MATTSKCNGNNTTLSTGPQSPPKQSFIHNNNNSLMYLQHQSFPPAEMNQMMMMMEEEERKRGLSRTQIDWLERSFQEDEGKPLEPERKMKLSQELGLHPRQVSIWFQNRRARWKNKQLQQLYQSLQQENQNLRYEVMELRARLGYLEMEKQKAGYMEATFIITEQTVESKSSVNNNQSSNSRIMLQDDHDTHYKQLKLLAEDNWLHI